jgi:hypothetical protein
MYWLWCESAAVCLPNTAEKDYQKQRSLSFPYNALYEWIERGYIIPADFCAKLNYSSEIDMSIQF